MGFFDRFKQKPTPVNRKGPPVLLAMVAFDDRVQLSAESLTSQLRDEWGLGEVKALPADPGVADPIVELELGDQLVMVSPMPAAIPWRDLEPLTTDLDPAERDRLRRHRFHFIVTALEKPGSGGEESSLASRLVKLSLVMAAMCRLPQATAVWSGNGALVFPSSAWVREVQGANQIGQFPLHLWARLIPSRGPDGSVTLVTRGLQSYQLMEMEIVNSRQPPEKVLGTLDSFASYQFTYGPVLGDGDTVGFSAEHKLKIRHLPSVHDPLLTVCRVEF